MRLVTTHNPLRAIALLLISSTLVTACATDGVTPQPVTVQRVEVPVPVKCRPNLSPAPDYPDTDAKLKAAPDLFARVQLMLAGRLMRIAREGELNAAVKACAG